MSEFTTYEHVTPQKKGSGVLIKKLLAIFFYIIFGLSLLALGLKLRFLPLFIIMPIFLWLCVFLTWRYTAVEYEYSITAGEVSFSKIYGRRSRRSICSFSLKDCIIIAPVSGYYDKLEELLPTKIYYATDDLASPDAYIAIYEDNGTRGAFCFEATEKALRICRFCNAPATVLKK